MNHIAHFLLAPPTVDGAIGTLLADFHRGIKASAHLWNELANN